WRATRDGAFSRLATEAPALGATTPDFESARERLTAAKDAVLAAANAARSQFIRAAQAVGTVVHEMDTAEQARAAVLQILRDHDARLLAKGKSMVAEEIFLNQHLEAAGIRVVET